MRMRVPACAVASLALGACATTGAPPHRPMSDVYAERYNADYDANKVAAVQQWAHLRGATVLWVNYPTRKPDGG